MRKPVFFAYEKLNSQISCAADQPISFRYIDSNPSTSQIQKPYSVVVKPGLCRTWSENPKTCFLTARLISGAHLKMYHGTQIDHISYNSGTIYFVCNKGENGVKAETLTFEHVKTSVNQAHFKFFTHLAC